MTTAVAQRRKRRPRTTLVLNTDFRPLSTWPLSVVSEEEAIKSVHLGKYIIVENWADAFYRSPSTAIAIPKVVALREYQPVSSEPKFCRLSIFLRDRFRCQYCGEPFERQGLTFDHVVPKARGGKTVWTNILTACHSCNAIKKDHDANYSGRRGVIAKDGRLRPLKVPRQPTAAELLRAGLEFLSNDMREDFGTWLYWQAELEA